MNDILTTGSVLERISVFDEANALHHNLKLTFETEIVDRIPFPNILIFYEQSNGLSILWFQKPTDTGVCLNYLSICPRRCKLSIVAGMVYRVSLS